MTGTRSEPRAVALAIFATIAAGFLIAGMDALCKSLMPTQGFVPVVWARYTFHAILIGLWLSASGDFRFLKPRSPRLQGIRTAFLMATTLTMYSAIQVVPLADATAVMFFAPVLITAFAGLILGESVGWRRYLAVVTGFIGVLIIVRPGFQTFEPSILLACATAVCYAGYVLLTRKLQAVDDERATLFLTTAPAALIMTLALPFFWQPVPMEAWAWMFMSGALGAGGHYLLIKAFHLVPASTLSPFLNAQLVAASIYSVAFFDDVLEPAFFGGAGLVVGSGLFIWWREQRLRRKII